MYKHVFVLRIINKHPKLAAIYLDMCRNNTDYEAVTEKLYNDVIINDNILFAQYKDIILNEAPKHIVKETIVTQHIKSLIDIYGWKSFIDGLELFAKNKETKLLNTGGGPNTTKPWEKIAKMLNTMPKQPQM